MSTNLPSPISGGNSIAPKIPDFANMQIKDIKALAIDNINKLHETSNNLTNLTNQLAIANEKLANVTNEKESLTNQLANVTNQLTTITQEKEASSNMQKSLLEAGMATLTVGGVLNSDAVKAAGTFLTDCSTTALNMGNSIYTQMIKGLSELKWPDTGAQAGMQSGMQLVTKSLPSFENVAKNLGSVFTTQNVSNLAKNPTLASIILFGTSIALARSFHAKQSDDKKE